MKIFITTISLLFTGLLALLISPKMPQFDLGGNRGQVVDLNPATSLIEPQNSPPEVVYVSKTARVSCYIDEGLTASGEYVRHGIVAVSDRSIPMDSSLYLEGFGIMDVRDKTAKWVHEKYPVMTIDIWMTAEECKEFGLKYLTYKLI
jgi:3D (Asp-Asp-Asp) domain-containing protein